jgi:hypothetical protein
MRRRLPALLLAVLPLLLAPAAAEASPARVAAAGGKPGPVSTVSAAKPGQVAPGKAALRAPGLNDGKTRRWN